MSRPGQRRYGPVWGAGLLLLLATLAFAFGRDSWKRTVTEPGADALYYYAYLPSIVLDRDLDFTNEYRITKNWYHLGAAPTGRPSNVFGIGPAIFEVPAFLVGHGLAVITGSRRDGFSRWETVLCMWTSIAFTFAALVLSVRLCRRRLGPGIHAYLGPLLALVSGPVLYYAIRQPGYGHPSATLFATWLIERWDASFDGARPRSLKTWIVLGAVAGAAMLARPQLMVWVSILAIAAIDDIRMRRNVRVARLASRWLAAAAIATIVVLPQLVAWKVLYGAWFAVPQGPGFMRWDQPAWSEVLFSSRNGLFPWAPLYAPMLIAMLCLARRMPRLIGALLVGFVAQAVVNGAAWDWWGGGSFGGRRFDSTFILFALGASAGLQFAFERIGIDGRQSLSPWRRRVARVLVTAALSITALVAIATVRLAMRTSVVTARIHGGEPASASWLAIGGLEGRLTAWLSNACTLPASAWFALRYDVRLKDYARVVGVHYLGETYPGLNSYPDKLHDVIEVGKPDPRISGLVPTTPGHARLAGGAARILVGLNRRGGVRFRLSIQASDAVEIELRWNGDPLRRAQVQRGGVVLEVETDDLNRGINTLEIRSSGAVVLGPIELFATPDR